METMELCVTACEKFSNNNEVLPLVQAPSCLWWPRGASSALSAQPAQRVLQARLELWQPGEGGEGEAGAV